MEESESQVLDEKMKQNDENDEVIEEEDSLMNGDSILKRVNENWKQINENDICLDDITHDNKADEIDRRANKKLSIIELIEEYEKQIEEYEKQIEEDKKRIEEYEKWLDEKNK